MLVNWKCIMLNKNLIKKSLDFPFTRKVFKYPTLFVACILSVIILGFLWLISPIVRMKIIGIPGQRLGHLALNTDLFFRRRQLYQEYQSVVPIFVVGRVANRQLLTMWKRYGIFIESRLLRVMLEYTQFLWIKTKFYDPLEINSQEFEEYNSTQPTLKLTQDEKIRGEAGLKAMGIDPNKDWFVCIFARDPVYLETEFGVQKDWSYHDYRNSDIDMFKLAIDYIVGLGGFVIRLGHHVAKPLGYHHPNVIDYASGLRTDFMDIYLVATCRFHIGCNSGITDVTNIFDTPRLGVNIVPPTCPPHGKNNLYIPKKIKHIDDKKYVSYIEYLAKAQKASGYDEYYSQFVLEAGWMYEENSAQEILDATIEMIARLENRYTPTQEDQYLLEQYYKFFPAKFPASKNKNPIGHKFLKQNAHLYFNESIIAARNYATV